ncbi:MAG: TIGR04076 family protein [Trueperaceae bacterium]|nr:MAG: TIGR04076 family protein [Trueperaceae bacterium]
MSGESFTLWDLRVEIVAVKEGLESICNHHLGDYFEVSGENMRIPDGKTFSIYALAAVLPLLPAKQRALDQNDWMASDDLVMCPDPSCHAVMKITRTALREFRRSEVTATPQPGSDS